MTLTKLNLAQIVQRRLEAVPALQKFVDQIWPLVSTNEPENFWRCDTFFAELLKSDFLRQLLNYELSLMAADDSHLSLGMHSETSFTVISTPHFGVSVRIFGQQVLKPRLLASVDHNMVGLSANSNGRLRLEDFGQNQPEPNDVFDRSRHLVARGYCDIGPGEFFRRRAGIDVGRLVFEGQTVVPIFFASQKVLPLRWEYDPKTLVPLQALAADMHSSRIEFSCRLMARLGDDSCLDTLHALTKHPMHFVRWAAISAIVSINQVAGRAVLSAATADQHPHVRASATKGITCLERDGKGRQ